MTAIVLQIVAGLAGIFSLWLRDYYSADSKAKRNQEDQDEATQQGRKALETGNADAVTARLDRVCTVQAAAGAGGDAGIKSSVSESGNSSTNKRLAAFGISTSETSGSGGSLPGQG